MPVNRCRHCRRGLAGYLYGEKELSDLTSGEVASEILRYQAKEQRIKMHMEHLAVRDPEQFPDGAACPVCGQGWREFQEHRKDLEQLTANEAKSALGANTRYLNALLALPTA